MHPDMQGFGLVIQGSIATSYYIRLKIATVTRSRASYLALAHHGVLAWVGIFNSGQVRSVTFLRLFVINLSLTTAWSGSQSLLLGEASKHVEDEGLPIPAVCR